MRPHAIAGSVLLLLVLSAFPAPPSTADSDAFAAHDFECGSDKPPSGPYLHYALGRSMNYDCRTNTFSAERAVTEDCEYHTDGGAVFVPLSGFCLGMSYIDCGGGWCNDRYKPTSLVAAVGSWNYSWETFYEEGSGRLLTECAEAPCSLPVYLYPCVSNAFVTYCKDGRNEVGFYCPGHPVTVKGELTASGTQTVPVNQVQSVDLCS